MIAIVLTSPLLIVNKALPTGRKFNQDDFLSSVLPWAMNQKRFTQKSRGAAFLLHIDNFTCYKDQKVTGQLTRANII
jgi:hypothetical protein